MTLLRDVTQALGPDREIVSDAELADGLARGTVVLDGRRRRPRYYDGLFLTAEHLTQDQEYFLARQADLARLSRGGVLEGLEVSLGANGRITVAAGHGLSPEGDLVLVREALEIDPRDVAEQQRLDASFGVETLPTAPAATRSGLYVLVGRPVEVYQGAAVAYPQSLDGDRGAEPREIVEGTLFGLVPFALDGESDAPERRRARAAHEIFVRQRPLATPKNALPLAMVSMRGGAVDWVDMDLVRRRAGVDGPLGWGLGHRSIREAFLLQYDVQLSQLQATGRAPQAASDLFTSLPPAGPLPRSAVRVEGGRLVQSFFPPAIQTRLSLIPDDEVPALMEESLALKPIELGASAAVLETMTVLVLVPVARTQLADLAARLRESERALESVYVKNPLAMSPIDALRKLRTPSAIPPAGNLAEWQRLLEGAPALVYTRARSLAHASTVVARRISVDAPQAMVAEDRLDGGASARIDAAGEAPRVRRLLANAGPGATRALSALLLREPFVRPIVVSGVVAELEHAVAPTSTPRPLVPVRSVRAVRERPVLERVEVRRPPRGAGRPLDAADVARAAERFSAEKLGSGLERLLGDLAARRADLAPIVDARVVPELDRQGRDLADADAKRLAKKVRELAAANDVEALRTLVLGGAVPEEPARPEEVVLDVRARRALDAASATALHRRVVEKLKPEVRTIVEEALAADVGAQPALVNAFLTELALAGSDAAARAAAARAALEGDVASPELDGDGVKKVLARYEGAGDGIAKLAPLVRGLELPEVERVLGAAGVVPKLDAASRAANDADRAALADQLSTILAAVSRDPAKTVTVLIDTFGGP